MDHGTEKKFLAEMREIRRNLKDIDEGLSWILIALTTIATMIGVNTCIVHF